MNLKPIGYFKSLQVEPYQAGRQPYILGLDGEIHLEPGHNYEQALSDLIGCSHIWIIFGFHKNENWKPLVQTPRSTKKIGVFATRAPYRPNPIGLSLVKLNDIQGLVVKVGANDILDGSPIYDIKPYHPEHDLAEEAHIDWLDESIVKKLDVKFSPLAEDQVNWLEENGVQSIRSFIIRQLEYDPINSDKKRVNENGGFYTLSYRTWRIDFSLGEESIGVLALRSGYKSTELDKNVVNFEDRYEDKDIHINFIKEFELNEKS